MTMWRFLRLFIVVSVVQNFGIITNVVSQDFDNSPPLTEKRPPKLPNHNTTTEKSPGIIKGSGSEELTQIQFKQVIDALQSIKMEITESKNSIEGSLKQIGNKLDELTGTVNNDEVQKIKTGQFYPLNNASLQKTGNITSNISRSCKELFDKGYTVSGKFEIQPQLSKKPFMAFCDMRTRGGGWTIIQWRFDGSENFNRSWKEYKMGFGDIDGEFWLGLDHIYELTGLQATELLVELEEGNREKAYAHFDQFKIASEQDGYRLNTLKCYTGTAGNSLDNHIGMQFSTYDKDQDIFDEEHCAEKYGGGWWFKRCYNSHLNGIYRDNSRETGIAWEIFGGVYHSLFKSRMLIK